MTQSNYVLITILICALCTQITRWLPFLLFGGKKEVPGLVRYLGTSLPAAIIAVLVVYCLCIAIKSHTKSLFTPHDGVNRLFYIDFPHGLLLIPFQLHSPYHRHASVPSSSLPQTPFPSFRTGLIIPSFTRPINTGTSSGSNCVPAPRSSSLTANSTDMLGL